MKKTQLTILVVILAIGIAMVALAQFWLKPAVEKEITTRITEYFVSQGISPQDTITAHLSPLEKKLTIDPFSIKGNPDLGFTKGHMEAIQMYLPWQAILAFSPLSSLVENETQIQLIEYMDSNGLTLNTSYGDITCSRIKANGVSMAREDFKKMKESSLPAKQIRPLFSVQNTVVEKIQLSQKGENLALSLGPVQVKNQTPTTVEENIIENILIEENGKQKLLIGKLTQKHINIFSAQEVEQITKKLTQPNQKARIKEIFALFFGKKPLVASTKFNNITIDVEGTPVNIGQIASTAAGQNSAKQTFSISKIALATKVLEEQTNQRLPLPSLLHLNVNLETEKKNASSYALEAGIDFEELFALKASLFADVKSLEDIFDNLFMCPLHNFRFQYIDKTLLARISLYFAPDGSGKQFFLHQVTAEKTSSPEEEEFIQKIITFIKNPGTVEISSNAKDKFTIPQVSAMSEEEIIRNLTLSVTKGSEDFDAQIKRIMQNP